MALASLPLGQNLLYRKQKQSNTIKHTNKNPKTFHGVSAEQSTGLDIQEVLSKYLRTDGLDK